MSDSSVHINHNGFREYDARWLYPDDINLAGIKHLGEGLGSQIISETKKDNLLPIFWIGFASFTIFNLGLIVFSYSKVSKFNTLTMVLPLESFSFVFW